MERSGTKKCKKYSPNVVLRRKRRETREMVPYPKKIVPSFDYHKKKPEEKPEEKKKKKKKKGNPSGGGRER